jgi:hypothetical protein
VPGFGKAAGKISPICAAGLYRHRPKACLISGILEMSVFQVNLYRRPL